MSRRTSWALAGPFAVLLALAGGCAEYMPYGSAGARGYGYGYGPAARPAPVYVAQASAPAPRATVARSTVAPVDRTSTGSDYSRKKAEVARWTAAERNRRIEEYLELHPETGYGEVRQKIQARLWEAKRLLREYENSRDILGESDSSREYGRKLQAGVEKEEAELRRIDELIVEAMLADEAGEAARRGAPTAAERGELGISGRNAARAAEESRRRADERFRNAGWGE